MVAKRFLTLSFMIITTIATVQERFILLFPDGVPEAKLNIVEIKDNRFIILARRENVFRPQTNKKNLAHTQ